MGNVLDKMPNAIDINALREKVIQAIEENFKTAVVIWYASGLPHDDHDDTEMFEAFWITDKDYNRFKDFVWDLEQNLANPNGYSIMVHCFSPEATRNYRWKEYQEAKAQKSLRTA